MATTMTLTLVDKVSDPELVSADPFGVLKELTTAVNRATTSNFEDVDVQRAVLYALENRASFGGYRSILETLLRARGLYPYLTQADLSEKERVAFEAHRPDGLNDIVFHQEQTEVYARLMAGQNVVLSAPTSFGKSLIVDAVIASGRFHNIAVIVPTIALIDETRRRLSARFGETFKVITHSSQQVEDKNIYVMTQERILDFEDLPPLDFFVIDEFYKLDPRRDSDRSLLLNQALYKLLKTGAQFYMLGPSIERIPESFTSAIRSTFISTPYSTVVTEHISIQSNRQDAFEKLINLCDSFTDPTLIYCASPASARRVASALVAARHRTSLAELEEASEWVGEHYHPDWVVARALSYGIGVHHGKVPRAIGQYAVGAFNDGHLKFLVCTSTLIEGVNTKAKNVVIFDNKVATRKFDYFTFNNIRGRSGRMFHHYVGRVYLFNVAPQNDLPFVDVPLITQAEGTPESLLIQLEDSDLTAQSKALMTQLHEDATLSFALMQSNSGIDPRAQMRLAQEIRSNGTFYFGRLNWKGFPEYEQLETACELIWQFFVGTAKVGGVYSAKQLAFRIDKLRKARSVRRLILMELKAQGDSPDADAAVEDVLDFVRTWASFHFPRYLMALDRIQKEVFLGWIGDAGDYAAYAASVENLFTTSGLVALDEYGVPLQVAERIASHLGDYSSVDGAVRGLQELSIESVAATLTPFEQRLVRKAQAGLGGRRVSKVRAQSEGE